MFDKQAHSANTVTQSIESVLLESKPDITPSTIETKEVNFSGSFSVIIDVCRTESDVDRYMMMTTDS